MTENATPVSTTERIESLDVLRGFALLGILIMNIQSFAMPVLAYSNPTSYGNFEGINWWVWACSHVFADQKFMAIFSMLFGAGICLFADRVEARGGSATRLHYRRNLWLLLFGAAHAHLLWFGDILVPYAISAFVVYGMRNATHRTLIASGVCVLLVPAVLTLLEGYFPEDESAAEWWSPSQSDIEEELAIYRAGWLEQLPHRSAIALMLETFLLLAYFLWRSAGMMLIGMALYRTGVLSARRSSREYVQLTVVLGLVGLGLIVTGVHFNVEAGFSYEYSASFGSLWNYFGSIALSVAYVGAIMLAVQRGILRWLQRRLAAAGRMAFTNYLMQTVLCTLFFYGHGLGYFGYLDRWQQALVVLAVWTILLVASPWWLARFRYGPMEWLWRSLTYWRRQPMRR